MYIGLSLVLALTLNYCLCPLVLFELENVLDPGELGSEGFYFTKITIIFLFP